jgi:hypothetical protein
MSSDVVTVRATGVVINHKLQGGHPTFPIASVLSPAEPVRLAAKDNAAEPSFCAPFPGGQAITR